MKYGFCTVVFILLVSCNKLYRGVHTANGEPIRGTLITRAQYGSDWPFKIDSLYLFRGEKEDVYAEKKGRIYAINSVASDMVDSGELGGSQMWYIIAQKPNAKQLKVREQIEMLGTQQVVNVLSRN